MRSFLLLVLCSCSAVISPDSDLLGGDDFDGGTRTDVPQLDAGPGNDSGPPRVDAGTDGGPPPDSGPGCEGRLPRCEGTNYVTCVAGVDVSRPCPSATMCDVGFGGCRPFDECPGGAPVCREETSLQCLGGPNYTSVACDEGCDAATGLCVDGRYRPSNLTREAFDDAAPDLDVPGGSFVLDTDRCEVSSGVAGIQPMTSGLSACVWNVGNLDMSDATYLRISGSLPLIVVASGDVNLDGTFDLRADGDFPGAGGFAGGSRDDPEGAGEGGGLPGTRAGDFGDGGGGGAGGLSAGGRGGNAGDRGAIGGDGGPAITTTGEPLIGGSGGGVGPGASGREGNGGAGGGAIQISALGTVTVRGTIRAGGGGGQGGTSATFESNWGAGGGGGAGGTILLEAPRVIVEGTLSVSGGGGGGGPSTRFNGNDNGSDGPTLGVARGAQNGTRGGDGGGATPEDGDSSDSDNGNGGGGGGSAGFVVVRGDEITIGGTLNPDVSFVRRAL